MPAFRNPVSVVSLQPALLLQPLTAQTNEQTKAKPLQPAVVHQIKRKLKIDFTESYFEIVVFIWRSLPCSEYTV